MVHRAVGDLTPYEKKVRSQNGEDGVIAEILRRIGASSRSFVEFGVESGTEGNCVLLAESGWSGLFMEGDAAHFERLQAHYADRPEIRTLRALVTPETIEPLLDKGAVPPRPDVLSIDIDSNDFYVWQAITSRLPRLVVIEYNAALPLDRRLVQPYDADSRWDGTDYFGASLGALEWLAARKGYELVHTDAAGVNAFFVRIDLLSDSGLPTGAAVPRRPPDYFGTGVGHPPDPHDRPWVDLDQGGALARCSQRSRRAVAG